jgi:hypothetical protein
MLFAAKSIPRLQPGAITIPLLGTLMRIMERKFKVYACDGRLDKRRATRKHMPNRGSRSNLKPVIEQSSRIYSITAMKAQKRTKDMNMNIYPDCGACLGGEAARLPRVVPAQQERSDT